MKRELSDAQAKAVSLEQTNADKEQQLLQLQVAVFTTTFVFDTDSHVVPRVDSPADRGRQSQGEV